MLVIVLLGWCCCDGAIVMVLCAVHYVLFTHSQGPIGFKGDNGTDGIPGARGLPGKKVSSYIIKS